MNKVFVIGRLTRDPEIRSTANGKKVAGFSIAVNEGKDAQGQEIVQYFDLSAWDRLAEIVELYIKKGTKIAVIGALKNRTWDKPDGTKGRATEIVVKELEILSSKSEDSAYREQGASTGNNGGPSIPPQPNQPSQDQDSVSSEELPEIDVDDLNVQMPF
jgi:single-strand DNA-binding protein